MTTLPIWDAVETAERVRRRDVTPTETVSAAIERVSDANRSLNFVVTERFAEGLDDAAEVDSDAPLAGVPILLKDHLATIAGTRHAEGSCWLADWIAPENSEWVRRIRAAGAVVIATSTTPEFALISTTEPSLTGPTRNPWDRKRSPGGSSGGSAAAVSAGVVPAAHGTDAGGSIRIPASCCGLFGLKPTRGRNTLGPAHGDLGSGIWAEHVLTRSIRDSAAFLSASAGPLLGDPNVVPEPRRSWAVDAVEDPPALRIAFSTTAPVPVDRECLTAAWATAELLAELGHEVVEAEPVYDVERHGEAFFCLYVAGLAARARLWERRIGRKPRRDELEPLTWSMLEQADAASGADVMQALDDVQYEARRVASFFADFDVWLTPTLALPPVPLGWFSPDDSHPLAALDQDGKFTPFTWLANATGQPAATLPLHRSSDGLPIGSHLMGRFGEESTLFSLAGQLSRAAPWPDVAPPEMEEQ